MSHPADALHTAVLTALIAANVASKRVYHRVPPKTPLPFIHIGDNLVQSDFDGGGEFYDCDVLIEVFGKSKPEVNAIVTAVIDALSAPLTIPGFAVYMVEDVMVRNFTDTGTDYIDRADVSVNFKVQST